MDRNALIEQIKKKRSFLCVGLDTDINKIPDYLKSVKNPMLAFNKAIIDATKDYTVAYKPNLAFYEAMGAEGWEILQQTIDYIPEECFVIADAKRGDIGNTSLYYAKSFFETLKCDALTVAPYMGHDSVKPFLTYKNKWVILLALTSNPGALDFQLSQLEVNKKKLYERVILKSQEWGTPENLMYVVGATRGELLGDVRKLAPNHFFLVPGVGAQGGSLQEVAKYGMNDDCGLLVNSSRGIIYAGSGDDFDQQARAKAKALQAEMEGLLQERGVI